jgi:hypothetical protein
MSDISMDLAINKDKNNILTRLERVERALTALQNSDVTANKISDMSDDLGVMTNGGFWATESEGIPTDAGWTGVFMDADGFDFGNGILNLGGIVNGVPQWSASNADGKIKAGAGAVTLDENGIQIEADTYGSLGTNPVNILKFIYGAHAPTQLMGAYNADGDAVYTQLLSQGNADERAAVINLQAKNTGGDKVPNILITAPVAGNSTIFLDANDIRICGNSPTDTLNAGGIIYSDTYTPTLYNTTNVAASTPQVTHYARIGNFVMVSGVVAIDTTTTGTSVLGMSLPIASAFSSAIQLGGTGALNTNEVARLRADVTNDRVLWEWTAVATANVSWAFSFGYLIV